MFNSAIGRDYILPRRSTQYTSIIDELRNTFKSGKTKPLEWRREQLKELRKMLTDNTDVMQEALYKDLRKPETETFLVDTGSAVMEVDAQLVGLRSWAKPEKVPLAFVNMGLTAEIRKEPLGVILVIGCFNTPVMVLLNSLAGILASGNCAVLKPSENAAHISELMASLIPKYLDQDAVRVIEGGPSHTTALLREDFDHISYTGGESVGRIVYKAAAEKLTPVTLELGGKTPVIVDSKSCIKIAARRILWGKCLNAGQLCNAPDYLLCLPGVKETLLLEMVKTLKQFYGDDPQKSSDYGRIINVGHFDRLFKLLSRSGRVYYGGRFDRDDLYIEPTILDDVKPSDPAMVEEIFGPLLPVLEMDSLDNAISFINNRPKALALYIFSNCNETIDKIISETSSGGVVVNDCCIHHAVDTLPKGGVGASGIGRIHGKYSFDTFSHHKAVLKVPLPRDEVLRWIKYPPYTDRKLAFLRIIFQRIMLPQLASLWPIVLVLFGMLICQLYHMFIAG